MRVENGLMLVRIVHLPLSLSSLIHALIARRQVLRTAHLVDFEHNSSNGSSSFQYEQFASNGNLHFDHLILYIITDDVDQSTTHIGQWEDERVSICSVNVGS